MNPKTSLPLHSPLQLQALSSLTAKLLERVSNRPYSHVLTIQFLLSPSQSSVMHWSTETIFITGNDDILGFFFFFGWVACRILVPQPGIKPMPHASGAQSINHWTSREGLLGNFFYSHTTSLSGAYESVTTLVSSKLSFSCHHIISDQLFGWSTRWLIFY